MTNDTSQISEREREILRLVATGATNQQIAYQLNISINTVKVHLRNIFSKIGAASRTEATLYAVRTGLVAVGQAALAVTEAPTDRIMVAAVADDHPAETSADPIVEVADQPTPGPFALENTSVLLPAQLGPAHAVWSQRRLFLAAGIILVLLIASGILLWLIRPTANTTTGITQIPVSVSLPAPSQRWRELASLPNGRAGFALASFSYEGKRYLYAVGGDVGETPSGQVLRYDIDANTWAPFSAKPTAVSDVQAAVIGNRIYIPGGRLIAGTITDKLEAYDPQHDRWMSLKALPAPRSGYALAVVEGKLYLFGGWDGAAYRAEVWQYNPDTDVWDTRTAMPTARAFAGAVTIEDRFIYVVGGENQTGGLSVNERYTPSEDNSASSPWATQQPLLIPRSHIAITATTDGRIFVMSGGDGDSQMLTYNNAAWQYQAIPLGKLRDLRALAIGSKIYIVGGRNDAGVTAQAYEYQALTTVFLPISP